MTRRPVLIATLLIAVSLTAALGLWLAQLASPVAAPEGTKTIEAPVSAPSAKPAPSPSPSPSPLATSSPEPRLPRAAAPPHVWPKPRPAQLDAPSDDVTVTTINSW